MLSLSNCWAGTQSSLALRLRLVVTALALLVLRPLNLGWNYIPPAFLGIHLADSRSWTTQPTQSPKPIPCNKSLSLCIYTYPICFVSLENLDY